MTKRNDEYLGFEQGPIRPPSEAASLLLRISRNCPWNRCAFCPVYKGERFKPRPASHVKRDIDAVARHVQALRQGAVARGSGGDDSLAAQAAAHWLSLGAQSVFLQDADALLYRQKDLVTLLLHLKSRFPWIVRVTTYARSATVARLSAADLERLRDSGLNRIHIGMESGSDKVLAQVAKGTTAEQQVEAGRKVIAAGIELSEYVMPGLGGRAFSKVHAEETARALNLIDPHFIRLRTLALPGSAPLCAEFRAGEFVPLSDAEVAEELLRLLEGLDGISSRIKSDHILNLFEDLEGQLPDDKRKMVLIVERFLALSPRDRMRYQIGRRMGMLRRLDDLARPGPARMIDKIIDSHAITPENVDRVIRETMTRFV